MTIYSRILMGLSYQQSDRGGVNLGIAYNPQTLLSVSWPLRELSQCFQQYYSPLGEYS